MLIGVDEHGAERLLAVADGVRESADSWLEALTDLKGRGMSAPKLAVGDGALGFWAALDHAYPHTRHRRCRLRKTDSIRTASPIESTLSTIRHRTKRSRVCLSRRRMLRMMSELGICAERRWRRLSGFRKLGKAVEGMQFKDGIEAEHLNDQMAA